MAENIGFIGLGIMGKPMARNLLKKGHSLVVFNRSATAIDEIACGTAHAATSPADVARCRTIILMLPDGPQVQDVIGGDQGILASIQPGTLVIDMSSISPDVSRDVAQKLQQAKARYVDAPVSGGEPAAVAGTLSIMCGGAADDVEQARPILLDMGKSVVRIGDVGTGQAAKLVNQVLVGLHLQATAEALDFAKALGLDGMTLLSAIRDGLAGSNVLNAKVPKMLAGDFAPGFKVRLHLKDLNNALATAATQNVDLPWTKFVHQQFQTLADTGMGNLDHSAVMKLVKSA